MTRRLAPLLAGTSAGSLGPADLEEIGVSIVAVDVLELRLAVGLDRIRAAGGLGAFIGWPGPIVAVARYSNEAADASGWRGRGLPQLLLAKDDTLTLRSAIDGAIVTVDMAGLRAEAATLGAESEEATSVAASIWSDAESPPPMVGIVTSDLAQVQAAAGRYYSHGAWLGLDAAATGPLVDGCRCRACGVAGHGYLAHLWAVREITAEHLLAWHNLHQLRVVVEGGEEG